MCSLRTQALLENYWKKSKSKQYKGRRERTVKPRLGEEVVTKGPLIWAP